MISNFLSVSELARRANQPLSAVLRLVKSRQLIPDATIASNGTLLFSEARLPELLKTLEANRHRQRTFLSLS